jgi:hypothetical protein
MSLAGTSSGRAVLLTTTVDEFVTPAMGPAATSLPVWLPDIVVHRK